MADCEMNPGSDGYHCFHEYEGEEVSPGFWEYKRMCCFCAWEEVQVAVVDPDHGPHVKPRKYILVWRPVNEPKL